MVEAAGARVVPLLDTDDEAELTRKLQFIDAVIFPGGEDGAYFDSGRFVFEQAIKLNDNGHYFPVYAICLGFENVASWVATSGSAVLQPRKLYRKSAALNFFWSPQNSQQFWDLGDQASLYRERAYFAHYHSWGVDP
jgi:hypothetical protein